MSEFQVLGGSPIGEGTGDEAWTPAGGSADFSPPDEIGMNKPLFIRLHRVFTGNESAEAMVVSSAVKADATFKAAPRAMHYLLRNVESQTFAASAASEAGSPIVYYSPANLDENLNLEVRLAFDDFDLDRYKRLLDLLQNAAGLPVFALSSVFGGVLAGAASQAIVAAAGNAVKVVLGALDRRSDADNDFVATYELPIDLPGRAQAKAGWVLLRSDKSDSMFVEGPGSGWPPAPEGRENQVFYVDPDDGHLHYRSNGHVVDDLNEPYVLLHVSGTKSERLKDYTMTRVSAAVLERFFSVQGDTISDVGALLNIYNDVVMSQRVRKLDASIKKAKAAEKAKLQKERAALLEHVQDESLREMLEAS